MKRGMEMEEFLAELRRRDEAKRDFLAPTDRIHMERSETGPVLAIRDDRFGITDHAHAQIADRIKIPAVYYGRMREEDPDLLGLNVNRWFDRNPETRLVRTLDGSVRAFLSDRYRPIDNLDVVNAVMPSLMEAGISRIESAEITGHHLWIQGLSEKVGGEVVGEVVQAGIVLSNSEVGCGAVKLESLLFVLSCRNGAVRPERIKRHHLGGRLEAGEDEALFTDATKKQIDKAFMMKLKDTASAMLDQGRFDEYLGTIRQIEGRKIVREEAKPLSEIVELAGRRFGFSQREGEAILENLIHDGNLSQWGMAQAVTRTANDVDDYDRAVELERVGGEVIEMEKTDWDGMWKVSA